MKVLKNNNNGFLIAEEDLKIRGHGDLLGYQQSGIKNFRFADPIHHKDLFLYAEKKLKELTNSDFEKYNDLIKLQDRAEIINDIIN